VQNIFFQFLVVFVDIFSPKLKSVAELKQSLQVIKNELSSTNLLQTLLTN